MRKKFEISKNAHDIRNNQLIEVAIGNLCVFVVVVVLLLSSMLLLLILLI